MFMLEVEGRIEQKMSTKYNGRGGNDDERNDGISMRKLAGTQG